MARPAERKNPTTWKRKRNSAEFKARAAVDAIGGEPPGDERQAKAGNDRAGSPDAADRAALRAGWHQPVDVQRRPSGRSKLIKLSARRGHLTKPMPERQRTNADLNGAPHNARMAHIAIRRRHRQAGGIVSAVTNRWRRRRRWLRPDLGSDAADHRRCRSHRDVAPRCAGSRARCHTGRVPQPP